MIRRGPAAVLALLLSLVPSSRAGAGDWLLRPTPDARMRELATDRPDVTESPYTVDAGHVQLESDLVAWSRDLSDPPRRATTWRWLTLNLKVGLGERTDLQFVLDPVVLDHVRRGSDASSGSTRTRGNGPLGIRLKRNLLGADGGPWALAVMPFVITPGAGGGFARGDWEAGCIVPLARSLGSATSAGVMAELDLRRERRDGPWHGEGVLSATFGRGLAGPLGGYVEWIGTLRPERLGGTIHQLSQGFTIGVTRDVQLDAGGRYGASVLAPRWELFGGLAWRR